MYNTKPPQTISSLADYLRPWQTMWWLFFCTLWNLFDILPSTCLSFTQRWELWLLKWEGIWKALIRLNGWRQSLYVCSRDGLTTIVNFGHKLKGKFMSRVGGFWRFILTLKRVLSGMLRSPGWRGAWAGHEEEQIQQLEHCLLIHFLTFIIFTSVCGSFRDLVHKVSLAVTPGMTWYNNFIWQY